jgi:hypothetical protein
MQIFSFMFGLLLIKMKNRLNYMQVIMISNGPLKTFLELESSRTFGKCSSKFLNALKSYMKSKMVILWTCSSIKKAWHYLITTTVFDNTIYFVKKKVILIIYYYRSNIKHLEKSEAQLEQNLNTLISLLKSLIVH